MLLIKFFTKIKKSKHWHSLLLLSIFLTAAYFRFAHLNWDQGLALHPDERNIAGAIVNLDWPRENNPDFYAYNGFPLYLADISSQLMAYLKQDADWLTAYGKINLITRFYSATFSLLSVFFIYLIAKKVFSKKTTLLTTFLASTNVTFIQHAHFGVTESLLVLELLILTYLTIQFIQNKRKIYIFLTAVILGISYGTKTSAFAYLLIPLIGVVLAKRFNFKTYSTILFIFLLSLLVFYTVSPYSFTHFNNFLSIMKYEEGVVSGQQTVFYTMQFINTLPYLFQIKTLFWQTSILILILAVFGLYFFLKNKKKYSSLWPILIFSLLYFLYVGSWYAKFNRYLMPLIPALILLSAITFEHLKNQQIKKFLMVLLIISQTLWAFAFMQIYQTTHVRITASHWIEDNIAENSMILHEERDERLPVIFKESKNYQYELLQLYQADTEEKINNLSEQLSKGDYLIIASQRLYKTIPRSSERPNTSRYYQLLFAEQLGYQKIMEFNAYPNLFGLKIKDDGAEETFSVFDHPPIFIFKNINKLSSEELMEKILNNQD